eukprot:365005-Chlamydomonas_euryale.AAC.1
MRAAPCADHASRPMRCPCEPPHALLHRSYGPTCASLFCLSHTHADAHGTCLHACRDSAAMRCTPLQLLRPLRSCRPASTARPEPSRDGQCGLAGVDRVAALAERPGRA